MTTPREVIHEVETGEYKEQHDQLSTIKELPAKIRAFHLRINQSEYYEYGDG